MLGPGPKVQIATDWMSKTLPSKKVEIDAHALFRQIMLKPNIDIYVPWAWLSHIHKGGLVHPYDVFSDSTSLGAFVANLHWAPVLFGNRCWPVFIGVFVFSFNRCCLACILRAFELFNHVLATHTKCFFDVHCSLGSAMGCGPDA
eukprot:GHVT01029242.1.p1 GENE.GHVT01029242.1~~GHVT01029242.1.p1  ORF type:complete len:145 (-),score=1.20 GHVT01029242.1:753-1187(-)